MSLSEIERRENILEQQRIVIEKDRQALNRDCSRVASTDTAKLAECRERRDDIKRRMNEYKAALNSLNRLKASLDNKQMAGAPKPVQPKPVVQLPPLKPVPKPPVVGKVDSQEAASMEAQRAKLQGELAALRDQMQGVRESLDRFNRAIQKDVAQMQEWQKTVDNSTTELFKRNLTSLLVDIPLMKMTSLYEQMKGEIEKGFLDTADWMAVNPSRKENLRIIRQYLHRTGDGVQRTAQRLKELNDVKATYDLDELVKEESKSKKVKDGILSLASTLADTDKATKMLSEAVNKVPNLAASQKGISYPLSYYIYCGNLIVDNSLDVTSMVVGWRETNRILYKNMDAYSKAIQGLSKRNEQIVKKIKEKEEQLAKLQISE